MAKKTNELTIKERLDKILEIGLEVKTPYDVMRTFGIREISIFGEQVCLNAEGDADYVTIEEAQEAVKWYAEQVGLCVVQPGNK